MRRVSTAAWVWAIGVYSYVVTTLSAAWFARRSARATGAPIGLVESLSWQGASYALWLPVAVLIWGISRRFGVGGRGLGALTLAMIPVVALESVGAAWVDMRFTASGGGLVEALDRALARSPVSILLYTALAAAGLAAVHRQRALEARTRADHLEAALVEARRLVARQAAPTERLMVSTGSRRAPVDLAQVEWFSAAGNYVVVHWEQREGLIRETLRNLEGRLDPAIFARSHRSTLVNLARVRETQSLSDGSWRLTMESGAELVASRTYRDDLLARLGR